jgi:superfamily II DNA or RNA helicase
VVSLIKLDPKYRDLEGGIRLTDEQVEGVEFLINRLRAVLAFQTGLGKTVTSLVGMKVIIDRYESARGIIICPVKAVKIFKKELKNRLGLKDHEIGLVTNQDMEYDVNYNKVFIFTNTSIKKYYPLIVELAESNKLALIVDEAHQLQDKKSGFYGLMEELKKFFVTIWFCTATPLLNDLDSLYNIISYLDKSFLGGKTSFLNRYTVSRLKDIWVKGGKKRKVRETLGYQNLPELSERLKSICIMRQKKYNLKFTDVMGNLTKEELEVYERVSKGIVGDEERTFGQRLHDLQRLVDNSYEDEMVSTLDSTKERLLIKSLKAILDKDYSVVVYVDYLDTVDRVERVLYENQKELGFRKLFQIKGSVDIKVRERVEDEIEERDIILVTRAGTESINLQKANCVVMYDIPYSIKDCIQLIGRVTRMDTEHDTQYIIILWTKGTIDEYKYLLFQDYASLIKQVLGSDANLPESLGEIDRKNLQNLKDKLLWHYKDGNKKIVNRKKRLLKENIVICNSNNYLGIPATHIISLNPIKESIDGIKRVSEILPYDGDYDGFIKGLIPLSVLRNKYIDRLKSDEGKKVLGMMAGSVMDKGSVVVLVDDYGISKILKDYILDNIKL